MLIARLLPPSVVRLLCYHTLRDATYHRSAACHIFDKSNTSLCSNNQIPYFIILIIIVNV